MKKIIITLCLLLAMNASVAQTINRNGNNFVAESTKTSKSAGQAIGTKYTYTDTDGKTYSIWLSKNGRAYIIRTSKSGKEYKKYLTEEISRTICKEMGVTYTEKTK